MKKEKILNKVFALLREGKVNDGVELLYKNYFGNMYGIAFSILKNENDSRDAVHNVIVKLLSLNIENFSHTNELGWLYTVVKNESLDLLKGNSRVLPLCEHMKINEAYEDEQIKAVMDFDDFQKIIAKLDKDRQAVLTLKVLGGFTHREIAEILGKPIGTVQWLYATSISSLKATMSVFLVASVISSVEMLRRFGAYVYDSINIPNTGGGSYTTSFDVFIVVFGILAILCVVISALVYFFGSKIPLKTKK